MPARLLAKLRQHFDVPSEVVPLTDRSAPDSPDALAAALAGLHYPAFFDDIDALLTEPVSLHCLGASSSQRCTKWLDRRLMWTSSLWRLTRHSRADMLEEFAVRLERRTSSGSRERAADSGRASG